MWVWVRVRERPGGAAVGVPGRELNASSRQVKPRTCPYNRRGLVCLEMREPPHTRRISRQVKPRTWVNQRRGVEVPGCERLPYPDEHFQAGQTAHLGEAPLQPLVGEVDANLLEIVRLEVFKPENIQQADESLRGRPAGGRFFLVGGAFGQTSSGRAVASAGAGAAFGGGE